MCWQLWQSISERGRLDLELFDETARARERVYQTSKNWVRTYLVDAVE